MISPPVRAHALHACVARGVFWGLRGKIYIAVLVRVRGSGRGRHRCTSYGLFLLVLSPPK